MVSTLINQKVVFQVLLMDGTWHGVKEGTFEVRRCRIGDTEDFWCATWWEGDYMFSAPLDHVCGMKSL